MATSVAPVAEGAAALHAGEGLFTGVSADMGLEDMLVCKTPSTEPEIVIY